MDDIIPSSWAWVAGIAAFLVITGATALIGVVWRFIRRKR